MQHPDGDHHPLDEPDEYDPEYEPDLEELAEMEFAARVELIDEWVKQHYRFATERHQEVLLEAVIKDLARRTDILTDDAPGVVGRACARAWRKIAREMTRPCETARTHLPQRLTHLRRAGCRPRERRDGRRRTTSSASSGDDPGGDDGPGESGRRDVATPSIAGWSR
jgi:hypothetical protein